MAVRAGKRQAKAPRSQRLHAPRRTRRSSHVSAPAGRRGQPPPWALKLMRKRSARRVGTLVLALVGISLMLGVAGARFARQNVGYVGVVRNGGPLDKRTIRNVLLPGQGLTWIGFFSQAPHEYPSAGVNRTYVVTADPKRGSRPGVDVVSVPTKDGVQVGVEATVFLRFVGESNIRVLTMFDTSYGGRKFPGADGVSRYPWDGDDGFGAWLDTYLRPILDYNLRREIGAVDCAQILASCSLVSRGSPEPLPVALVDSGAIAQRISEGLEADLTRTIGQPYFRDIRIRISRLSLPHNVQVAVNGAQASYAAVSSARAGLKQARYTAESNKLIGDSLNRSPGLATIEALKSIPKGSTVIVSQGGKSLPIIAPSTGTAATGK
jgi:regulator of protease activity HflC (stomatin/prohibitin superfamily)